MRGSLESIIKHMIKLNNHKSNISFPAIVVNTDNLADGFIDVKPLVNNMNSVTGETIEYPPIRNVQVLMPSSKSSSISFPIVQGDTVDLLFQSVDIVDFVNGEKEAHDPFGNGWGNLANVVALVGFTPYQESPFNPNNYSNDFNNQDLNIVHNKNTGLESSVNISASGSILQKAPNAVTVDSPLFDVKSDLLNANNAIITTGGDVVVQGQSLNQFMLDAPLNLKGSDGDRGWSPVLAVEGRGLEDAVLKLTDWVGGEGDKPSEQGYIGSNGLVDDILDAINIRGARGATGKSGAALSADTIQEVVNDQLTTDRILDLIQGQIDESALTDILTSKIEDIEVVKWDVAREARERANAITETAKQIEAEAEQRVEDIRLAAEAQKDLQDFADRLSGDIDTIVVSQTETDDGIAVIKSKQSTFEIEQGVQAESLTYLSSQIDFGYADKTKYADKSIATAWTFAKTVAHADYSNSQMITGLSADYKDSSARYTENIELLSRQNEATATKTTTLSAQVLGNDYEGGGLGNLNSGLIFEESEARASDVEGLAEQISLLSAGVGEQFDSFEIWHFNKDKDGWTGGTFSGGWIDVKTETLQSPEIIDLDGAIYKHVKLRVKKFGQPTWSGLLTHVGGSKTIKEPNYDEDGVALANWQLEWTGDITSFTLKLASVADDTNYYSIDWVAVGRPSPGASNAALLRESKVRASETSANARDLVRLDSQINGGTGVPIESSITKQLETTANVAKTTAEEFEKLTSTYNTDMYTYEGVVQTTARTLAGATQAEAERLDLLSADIKPRYADASRYVNINRATQWTYWKTIAADNYNSNQRVSELKSEFLDSNANFTNELFTLATKDKAIAADITQLYAETGENFGLIQEVSLAISKPEGGLAAKVTELQGRATAAEVLLTEKGEIIFSYGAPPTKKEDKNNVWFKLKNEDNGTVSQTPHQWDGLTWVELKDSAALAARADAAAAKMAAENKGEVIYSSTKPLETKQLPQNLWIDTSLVDGKPANTPKRWNGLDWVAVTDKAATDAAAAAKDADDKAKTALATLKDISADDKLTPVEKKQITLIWEDIKQTDIEIRERALKYDVSTALYNQSFNDLASYIKPLLLDTESTSNIVRTVFDSKFSDMYSKRATLDTNIVTAAKKVATDAQSTANSKGETIFSATKPSEDKQLIQNLWIDISGNLNTPKRWNGIDWVEVTDKAAKDAASVASDARAKLNDIAADNKLTAVEKKQTKLIADEIKQADSDMRARALKYGVSSAAYTITYNALVSYIDPLLVDLNATDIISRTTFNARFNSLYGARATLDTAINTAAKNATDAADGKAESALSTLKDISADDKLTPVEKKQLRIIIDEIKRDNDEIVANADKYEVSTAEYLTAFNALVNYVDALLMDVNPTSDIVRGTFNSRFDTLYLRQAELNAAINTKTNEGIKSASEAAKEAAELAGNKGEVIYSSTEPTKEEERKAQNLWIDTSEGKNTPKRWAGSSWLTVTDKAATDAQEAANKANRQLLPENIATLVEESGAFGGEFDAIAGKITGMQGVVDGQKTAIETISAVGNVEKLKNEIAKARLDKDLTNLNAQVEALDNAIVSYDERVVELTAKRNAPKPSLMTQEAYIALQASYQSQIEEVKLAKVEAIAQKDVIADNAKQLADEKEVLDSLIITEKDVKAQHTIKIDAGGKIAGYGLVVQKDNYSAFDIRADRFTISPPANGVDDGKSPFMVLTTPTEIEGVEVEAGTYIRGSLLASGTITGDKIRSNTSITAPNIIGGNINIGNGNFTVNSNGDLYAESGTFKGTVLAEKISGTIDIESMKRSAWSPAYKVFYTVANWNVTPSTFNREFHGSHVSYGSISVQYSDVTTIGAVMFEIDLDVRNTVTVRQNIYALDDTLAIYVNGVMQVSTFTALGIYHITLPAGKCLLQFILTNTRGGFSGLTTAGDFIDNDNIKFA